MKRFTIVSAAAFWAAFLCAAEAHAHSWYSVFCCNKNDCQPLPDDAVLRSTLQGYEIEYRSQHGHMVKGFVAHENIKPSQDGDAHACETVQRKVRCLYLPLGS